MPEKTLRRMISTLKQLRKVLAVIAAGTVISSSAAVSLPLYAAGYDYPSQSFSVINYDSDREFTVRRYGDLFAYGQNELAIRRGWGFNNRMPTGIWASYGQKLKVHVQANPGDKIPQIMFTQHLTDGTSERIYSLKEGANEIDVPMVTYNAKLSDYTTYEQGGLVYILNPYNESEQSNNVRVYIEGGEKVPFFKDGDNVSEFVSELRAYYSHYAARESGYHNITELGTKHLAGTFTLEAVYEAYVRQGLNPQKTVSDLDNFYEKMLEFDGVTPDQYKYLNNHLKVTVMSPGVYAYASSNGIVAFPTGDCEPALLTGRFNWGMAHEFGHIFDVQGRALAEVTNNMWTVNWVLNAKEYHEYGICKNSSIVDSIAVNEVNDFWKDSPVNVIGIVTLWDLEVYHNGYWGELDSMYRRKSCGNAQVDYYVSSCTDHERFAIYSSKILGLDLTYYFKRYGYLKDPSTTYYNAINALGLSRAQPKIWYYDNFAYIKPKGSNVSMSSKPSVASFDTNTRTIYFNLPMDIRDNHLCFEIFKDGEYMGITWDTRFTSHKFSDGVVTVNAYDRALNHYSTFTFNIGDTTYSKASVARVGSNVYTSIEEAIAAAPDNSTVYISKTCGIRNNIIINNKHITLMPENESVYLTIYNRVMEGDVFTLQNGASLTITSNSNINDSFVLEGLNKTETKTMFRLQSGSSLKLGKGVAVMHMCNLSNGSVAYAENNSSVELAGCLLQRNVTNGEGVIYLTSGSKLTSSQNTIVRYNRANTSGSFLSTTTNESVSIKDTVINDNYCLGEKGDGTIAIRGTSVINVGKGTEIKDNHANWYDYNSAMSVAPTARAIFRGKINITNNVTVSSPIELGADLEGKLFVRPEANYASSGNALAKPADSAFPSGVLSKISLGFNRYFIGYNSSRTSLVLSDTAPVISKAKASAQNICVGDNVRITLNAEGGSGGYSFDVKLRSSTGDSLIEHTNDFRAIDVKIPSKSVNSIVVSVSDYSGNYDEQIFRLSVVDKFVNKSSVSENSIGVGGSVTVNCAASGGNTSYKYAVYYKKSSDTKWAEKQKYSTNKTVKITLSKAVKYDICVKAKDSKSRVSKKYFTVSVTSGPLTNKSVVSAEKIAIGKSFTLTGKASGGSGSYKYAVYFKKSSETKWAEKQSFAKNNKLTIKPGHDVKYDLCVKVKDTKGKIAKKYFVINVYDPNLKNTSALSASSVTLGGNVTVKASASGGAGSYKYAVYYKKSSDTKWAVKQNFSSNKTVTITPSKAVKYNVCVKVKDKSGKIIKKYFTITTSPALNGKSKISAYSVKLGKSFSVTGAASGGTGTYKYAVYYKKVKDTKWAVIQDFKKNSKVTITPAKAVGYDVCVKIKDGNGTVVKQYFTVNVSR